MRHFEVHLVTNQRESVLLAQGGLPPVHLEPHRCGACDRPVGELDDGHFTPVGVALNASSISFLCEPCLHPILKSLPDLDNKGIIW